MTEVVAMPVQPMTIGQLAAAAGVTRKAIRVWLDKGLLVACDHTPAGYRLFGPDAVRRAQFIRRARGLGLSLEEIRSVLRAASRERCPCVRRLARARVADIDATIADLSALRAALAAASEEPTAQDVDAAFCPIIERSTPSRRDAAAQR